MHRRRALRTRASAANRSHVGLRPSRVCKRCRAWAAKLWITWALPANYVRSVLGQIGAPALVICRSEGAWLPAGSGRYRAHEIPDS